MDNTTNINATTETEIDLLELFYVIKGRILVIIAAMLVCGILGLGYTKFLIQPLYSSTSELYILTQSTSITSLTDIQLGTQLTADYVQRITGRPVMEQVIKNLKLDYTYSELLDMVNINNPDNTRILKITVNATEPEAAKAIADEIAEVSRTKISDIMNTDKPNVIQNGYVVKKPVNVHYAKNILISMILGFVLSAGIIIVLYLMDDTIVTSEDVEKYLGLNTLSAIPFKEDEKASKKNKRMGSSSKKGAKHHG